MNLTTAQNDQFDNLLIKVEHVTKTIKQHTGEVTILENVNFAVAQGALFAIKGPSGSGKSTLMNILTGIDRPTRGRVIFSGQEIRQMNESRMAYWRGKHVGIVFQFFQLLPTLTALENILLAMELANLVPQKQRRARALECLRLVEVEAYAKRLPAELSGGQQQRVAIARALANDPPLIIADEPTGNLDSKMAGQVFDLLESLVARGKTVIYVTHDASLAERAENSIELLDGRITKQTAHSYLQEAVR